MIETDNCMRCGDELDRDRMVWDEDELVGDCCDRAPEEWNLITEPGRVKVDTEYPPEMPAYRSNAAKGAYMWKGKDYADHIERHRLEMAARLPDRAAELMAETIGQALAGNDGE